nr:hypothetical protein [Dechloromonas sp.]
MTHPAFIRLPLETLLAFSHDARVYRSFDHLILPGIGSLLLVPVWMAVGDLTKVVDGCPVSWEEVCDVLDAPADAVSVSDPDIVPAPLRQLAGDDWIVEVFRLALRKKKTRRFVHTSGIRFADI